MISLERFEKFVSYARHILVYLQDKNNLKEIKNSKEYKLNEKLFDLESRIENLENSKQTVSTHYCTSSMYCEHEYPTVWHGTVPPYCIKCGLQAQKIEVF